MEIQKTLTFRTLFFGIRIPKVARVMVALAL